MFACVTCVCMRQVMMSSATKKETDSTDIEERGAAEGEKEGRVSMFD